VGISGTTCSRFESFKIAHIVKEISPRITTVYGGCHAAFTAEDTLLHIKEIDYIVHGEGEVTLLELVKFILRGEGSLEEIKGISYRARDQIVSNAPRERIMNLDDIPYSRHLLEMDKYDMKLDFLNIPATSIMTSRGCFRNCYFCSASAIYGGIYTRRSAKHVVDEIQYCIDEFGVRGIKFFDSALTLNKEHVLSLGRELKNRNLSLPWECYITVDTVDKSLLGFMKDAGCYYVNFGVEAVTENVLATINKRITLEQVTNVFKWCKELDIKTKVFFSFGHVGQSWEDAFQTIAFIEKNLEYISSPGIIPAMRIYPGTRLEKYAKDNGLLPKTFSWSGSFENIETERITTDNVPIVLQPALGVKELEKISYRISWIFIKLNYRKDFFKKIMSMLRQPSSIIEFCVFLSRKTIELYKILLMRILAP
jgi:radical SAM superfamily enzyme YgiQ (UPF0313 family)